MQPLEPPAEGLWSRLKHQSRGRPISPSEAAFAGALEAIFSDGVSDFAEVTARLTAMGIAAPVSGATTWTLDLLDQELALVNAALDDAYARGHTRA